MRFTLGILTAAAVLAVVPACSRADKETAREREVEAQQKTRDATERTKEAARKLTDEAKEAAKDLKKNVDHALEPGQTGANGAGTEAEAKLRDGGAKLREASGEAGVKLGHAAVIARVKAKLASEAGLDTVKNINVDESDHVVTLRGTVATDAQRQQATQAAGQVDGVTKVVDELKVQP